MSFLLQETPPPQVSSNSVILVLTLVGARKKRGTSGTLCKVCRLKADHVPCTVIYPLLLNCTTTSETRFGFKTDSLGTL